MLPSSSVFDDCSRVQSFCTRASRVLPGSLMIVSVILITAQNTLTTVHVFVEVKEPVVVWTEPPKCHELFGTRAT